MPARLRRRGGRDLENLRARTDLREGRRIGAGHPDLGAERFELAIERGAAFRIEVGDHFIEQQDRSKRTFR